ncbi:dihydroorotase [Streptomyces chumphonensis]|uniref:Dihydroorotase family protein n=1 Tax=Streptomyces chumphonensis TaxID=1214925 RepID=A0A927F1G0_9ACTN|nr:dihydroorotase family protein [Streptomyces chumphonensis]MBD3933428.1 dihydroorotase family protein [Streptomyces chumphonensis]
MSTNHDLVITGARVVTPDGVHDGGVAVSGERIATIFAAGSAPTGERTIDAGGRYLLPGLIDSHVHFRTPGLTHKEDWAHGSRAAAAGGVTTVIDMPNTEPPLVEPEAAADKAALVAGHSLVDYRFHMGVTVDSVENLRRLEPRQATTVKVFMTGHHTAPNIIRDPVVLDRIFAIAAEHGIRLVLHAEDDGVFSLIDESQEPPAGYDAYESAHPRSGGIVASSRVIDLVRKYGTAAHILHVSSSEESDMLKAANRIGLPITYEVTPHHLSFSAPDTQRLGARIRLRPAIRCLKDQGRLWEAVMDGGVATIGSDHAPHTKEEKVLAVADAPPGLPGTQEMLLALHTGMRRRYPEMPQDEVMVRIARVAAERPAELFGLTARKGRIAVGLDADFSVFDPDTTWIMSAEHAQAKVGWSAYEGWTFTGRPELTVRRGEIVYDGREETPRFGTPTGIWLDAERPVLPDPVPSEHATAVPPPPPAQPRAAESAADTDRVRL